MKNYIQNLYNETIRDKEYKKQIDDFIHSDYNYDKWRKELFNIEKKIGGIGIHNVNTFFNDNEDHITGTYELEDRDIFRPIQYSAQILLQDFIALDTRYLIDNSCAHIESLLKKIFLKVKNLNRDFRPMGALIKALLKIRLFNNKKSKKLIMFCVLM